MSGKSRSTPGFGVEATGRAASGRTINIAIIGASGRVGRRVLELVSARRAPSLHLRVVAAANSRAGLLAREGLSAVQVFEGLALANGGSGDAFAAALLELPRPLIVIDCSAAADIAARYPQWLAAGIDVVTPNKLGPSADRPLARAIAAAQAASGAVLRDAATVGAQLPLLATLRDLRAAGDRVERFEAVLSGTLSYVLGGVQAGATLSAAVADAVALGYAEPHPARDLSGEDVARKLVIILRGLGHDIELADVERIPLVDAVLLEEKDPLRLVGRLQAADETWRARAAIADARHERWIYRASFDGERARVAPERVPLDHPLARLAPCENALILHSAYYRAAPLSIAGPGAGIDLTAAGVFADVTAAAQRYAAPGSVFAAAQLDCTEVVEAAA